MKLTPGVQNLFNDCNPEFKFSLQGIRSIQPLESKIQERLGLPYIEFYAREHLWKLLNN